ncbi:uncharacterized protein LOC6533837 [Drosophila yakuba]|uniref:Uncharacterized protein n=1 Tax=Drosophila yakuba TaxID=7245 RepID=B4PG85_DROYA|nr:uncharacterized protein LOC6533837 [Drosophila yakuba]EDW94249.1 uncharacterized protein Dyak_GE21879 [Drosophila yakuba]
MMIDMDSPDIPDEVINYVEEQRVRQREFVNEKELLKERIKKAQDMLKLLEGRPNALPCTIACGNIYQQSTVQQMREALAANLSTSMEQFIEAHRNILAIQRVLSQDYETISENANRSNYPNLI